MAFRNLRYRYFQFHDVFSFYLKFVGHKRNSVKEKRLIFYLFYDLMNLHKKLYTTGLKASLT